MKFNQVPRSLSSLGGAVPSLTSPPNPGKRA